MSSAPIACARYAVFASAPQWRMRELIKAWQDADSALSEMAAREMVKYWCARGLAKRHGYGVCSATKTHDEFVAHCAEVRLRGNEKSLKSRAPYRARMAAAHQARRALLRKELTETVARERALARASIAKANKAFSESCAPAWLRGVV